MKRAYSSLADSAAVDWRQATADDRRAVARAFTAAFGRGRAKAVWDAIYDRSPDGSLATVACLGASGRIVAHYGGTLHPTYSRDDPARAILTVQTRDAFSDPEMRGRLSGHLFQKTASGFFHAAESLKVALAVGFGSSRHSRLGRLSLGYQPLYGLQRLLARAGRAAQAPASHGCLIPVSGFQPDFDALWKDRVEQYGLALERSSRFMAWRFGPALGRGARVFLYRTFTAPHAVGYAVLRPSGGRWLLMDVAFPPSHEMIRDFWEQLLAWMDAREGIAIETWCCAHAPEYPIWMALGFAQQSFDKDVVPCFRICDPRLDSAWVQQNLLLTMADADIV